MAPTDFRTIVDLQLAGRLDAAETALRAWIIGHPGHAEAHGRLGMVLQATGRTGAAMPCFETAARLDPANPQPLCLLGAACHALGRLDAAAAAYRRALALAPRLGRAWNNLGLVLGEQGDLDGAVAAFRAVLAFAPDYATALGNLGAVLAEAGRDLEALPALRAAARHAPAWFDAWRNLGAALGRLGQPLDAVAPLETALRLRPRDPGTRLQLAQCLEQAGRAAEAIRVLEAACGKDDPGAALRMALARLLAGANRAAQARAVYADVLAARPDDLQAAIGAHLTLPLVYASGAEVARERTRFADGLDALETWVEVRRDALAQCPPARLLAQLAWVNFPLAYHGHDDRALQARYGRLVTGLLQDCAPALAPAGPRAAAGRIRIGFAASLFCRGTVHAYFAPWVGALDKGAFETFVYHSGAREDAASAALAQACDHYLALPLASGQAAWDLARRIAADALDILVYPELGMTAELFPLAALRLAPVQCAAWGHPVTTGLPTIDAFLSCDPMETPDAQAHYSERLLCLPGLGTCYPRPVRPAPGDRAAFGLPAGRRLYLFPHAPFKIHPDNDALLAGIAARDPEAMFVLVGGHTAGQDASLAHAVAGRIEAALAAHGVAPAGRLHLLPYLAHEDYLRVNRLCDLMLDCLHWSGGNTTLDAIASGLPVVTLPGATMRSRQSAAMLRMAGLDRLVAAGPAGYVETALRIAGDPLARAAIRQQLERGADAVFGQTAPLQALDSMLRGLAHPPPAPA